MARIQAERLRRRLVSTGVVVCVAASVVAFGLVNRSPPPARDAGPGIEPLLVARAEVAWRPGYTVARAFVGRVEARQESEIGFEISGRVVSVAVEEGQVVAAGDLVATLDTARLEARRAELVAARDRARADRELAELTLLRVTEARELSAASAQEWDDADKTLLAAQAQLSSAEAAITSVDVDIGKAVIRSPFHAVVARRHVDTGQVIDAGAPVVRLLERAHPEVRVGVGGAAVDAIEPGQRFGVRIRDRVVDGVVTSVLPTRDRAGRAVDVVIALDAELDGIRSGDLARVSIDRPVEARGFWVPMQALTEGTRGLWAVYTLEPRPGQAGGATVRRTNVEVLHAETDRVFARGPLEDGQAFVRSGLHRVAPGMLVRVEASGTPAGGG